MDERISLRPEDLPPEAVAALEGLAASLFPHGGSGYVRIDLEDGVAKAMLAIPTDLDDLVEPEIEPPDLN